MHPRDEEPRQSPEADVLLAVDGSTGPEFAALAGHGLEEGPRLWRSSRFRRLAATLVSLGLAVGLAAPWLTRRQRRTGGPPSAVAPVSEGSTLQLSEPTTVDYEVYYEGFVEVYKWKAHDAPVMKAVYKCTPLRGVPEDEWVKLVNEPGYIPVSKDNTSTLRPIPVYAKIDEGYCGDIGMFPVRDAHTCELAAKAMKLPYTKPQEIILVPLPEGCHMFMGLHSTGLYLATNPINNGTGALHLRHPICSSYDEPSLPCRLPTTTITTTTTTTTWGWPSLFCILVAHREESSLDDLRKMLEHHAGVFGCDEPLVLYPGEPSLLGEWAGNDFYTMPLPEGAGGNITDEAPLWKYIQEDGHYQKHDWVVRAGMKTVFFAERLRDKLKAHTPHEGASLFLEKCDRFNPTQSYGNFEVRSRKAVDAFFDGRRDGECSDLLANRSMPEEEFVQKCMEDLKVDSVYDASVLQDASCGSVNCWDKSRVAFHIVHQTSSYWDCWQHATR